MFKEIIFDKLAWRFLLIQLKLYIQNIVLLSLKNQSILWELEIVLCELIHSYFKLVKENSYSSRMDSYTLGI